MKLFILQKRRDETLKIDHGVVEVKGDKKVMVLVVIEEEEESGEK